ncbi:cytidylate kinase family protein [Allofournierella massiliensis]|uniref:Cytidylate kinase family protein n=1 Tax=Allofournierella massiliensis TaxID=1650663 RepID=A0ABT7UUJ6_9FIRM|nr:cytidylate kinase family protein [Fournierella massiliensis]MDM8202542.1 cytidylate kinase family protein [Fournierella massiliensis]
MEKAKRYLVFLFGLFISSFGVSLITKANLGTSPISAIPYVLSLNFPFTLGQFTIAFSLFLILLQLFILRRNFKAEHLLQIPISVAFGYFIDLTMVMLGVVAPGSYPVKLVALLIGCVILGFGVYLEVIADVAMLPGESFVRAVTQTWKTDFGTTKVCFDVSMTVIAAITSLVLAHTLYGVREGTVIAALLVGFIARLFGRLLPFVPDLLFGKKAESEAAEAVENGKGGWVIAIGRQYGSGGRVIGQKLAQQLGYEFYDDAIVQMAAGTTGYTPQFVRQREENMTNSFLYDLVNQMYAYAPEEESPKDSVFLAEKKAIEEIAAKGRCVIVGRCADYLLRDDPHCLRVWLHADKARRVKRIMELEQLDEAAARTRIAQEDRRRATNYQYYTRRVWGLGKNYHLTLDTGLGEEYVQTCIEAALKALEAGQKVTV